jgi:hypothetical protein
MAVISAVEYELNEVNHRETVAATVPAGADFDAAWVELSSAIYDFLAWRQRRIRRNPRTELKRWQRIEKHTTKLAAEVRAIKRRALWTELDAIWADEFLAMLSRAKQEAEQRVNIYSTQAKFPREHLYLFYDRILRVWTTMLGGKLSYSKPSGHRGPPSGSLINFFSAAVDPVLCDKAPNAYGIADIIDRARTTRNARTKTNAGLARKK